MFWEYKTLLFTFKKAHTIWNGLHLLLVQLPIYSSKQNKRQSLNVSILASSPCSRYPSPSLVAKHYLHMQENRRFATGVGMGRARDNFSKGFLLPICFKAKMDNSGKNTMSRAFFKIKYG